MVGTILGLGGSGDTFPSNIMYRNQLNEFIRFPCGREEILRTRLSWLPPFQILTSDPPTDAVTSNAA